MVKGAAFNLAQAIRDFQQSHRGVPAKKALEAVKKAHPGQNINEGTFLATFYKSGGRKKVVKRRKRGRVVEGNGSAEHVLKAGLHFIVLAGGVEAARERLIGLEELIEAAKNVD
jgi:hypothetical protein